LVHMTITRSEFVCTTHLAKTFSGVQTKIKCLADKKIPQEKSQKFSVLQTKKILDILLICQTLWFDSGKILYDPHLWW
jgi:hypothetical protein